MRLPRCSSSLLSKPAAPEFSELARSGFLFIFFTVAPGAPSPVTASDTAIEKPETETFFLYPIKIFML